MMWEYLSWTACIDSRKEKIFNLFLYTRKTFVYLSSKGKDFLLIFINVYFEMKFAIIFETHRAY